MTYQDQQALSVDQDFINRTWAALSEQAQLQPAADPVAIAVLKNPFVGVGMFMPFLATAPTFGDQFAAGGSAEIDDLELLSAIQAAWAKVPPPVTQ
jgi:hypothetical protein